MSFDNSEMCLPESTIDNLYSVYKELKFERKRHREDVIKKCAEFWRYINTRPDIEPVQAKLLVNADCEQCKEYYEKASYSVDCGCQKDLQCDKARRRWLTTLIVLHNIGCDKAAINATKQCKLCEQNEHIFQELFTHEDPNSIQAECEQIRALSEWQANPHDINKNVYESHSKSNKH